MLRPMGVKLAPLLEMLPLADAVLAERMRLPLRSDLSLTRMGSVQKGGEGHSWLWGEGWARRAGGAAGGRRRAGSCGTATPCPAALPVASCPLLRHLCHRRHRPRGVGRRDADIVGGAGMVPAGVLGAGSAVGRRGAMALEAASFTCGVWRCGHTVSRMRARVGKKCPLSTVRCLDGTTRACRLCTCCCERTSACACTRRSCCAAARPGLATRRAPRPCRRPRLERNPNPKSSPWPPSFVGVGQGPAAAVRLLNGAARPYLGRRPGSALRARERWRLRDAVTCTTCLQRLGFMPSALHWAQMDFRPEPTGRPRRRGAKADRGVVVDILQERFSGSRLGSNPASGHVPHDMR